MSRPLVWPLAILLSCALISALTVADADGPVRLVAALWFVLVCPGMSFALLLPRVSGPARLGLGIALSLAIDTAVVTAMLAVSDFSATAGLLALQVICIAGCVLQMRRLQGLRRTDIRVRVRVT